MIGTSNRIFGTSSQIFGTSSQIFGTSNKMIGAAGPDITLALSNSDLIKGKISDDDLSVIQVYSADFTTSDPLHQLYM